MPAPRLPFASAFACAAALALMGGEARADESSPAPPESAPRAPAAAPAASRGGVAVVLVGAPEATPAKQARDLARASYASKSLRPSLDEEAVRVLCGGEAGQDARLARLAELRAGLGADLSDATTRSKLDALAAEIRVSALVLFVPGPTGPVIRIAHVDAGAAPKTRIDPASIAPAPKEGEPGALDLDAVVASIEKLVTPRAPELPKPPPVAAAPPKPGPRKENLSKKKQPGGPPPRPETDDTSFFESPWFWVAVGGVAATGLTILIVSQVTDVDGGTVALKGKVLP